MTKARILVVDKSETSHGFIKASMPVEYEVIQVLDGKNALALLEKEKFDLMFLDLNLPDMDGMEVLQEVNKLYSRPRVVILSSSDNVEEAVQVMKSGAADYIAKPLEQEKIWQVIREAIESYTPTEEFPRPYWL